MNMPQRGQVAWQLSFGTGIGCARSSSASKRKTTKSKLESVTSAKYTNIVDGLPYQMI
jgi:hypothetical protein